MTEPTPMPENQNPTAAPGSEENHEATGFFSRVQRELKPKHPTEEQEIVVDMTPIKRTDPDGET